METAETSEFSSDRPIAEVAADRLNRAPFAQRIAGVLKAVPQGDGVVVGIHGLWGDGKTSVLNLLRRELKDDSSIVVTDFNPWRMADEDAMLRGFFSKLVTAIGKSIVTTREQAKAAVGKWTKPFRWITRIWSLFSKSAETADKLLEKLSGIASSGDSVALEELRARVFQHLSHSSSRIVVLIDDIDRLDKNETHGLFRLIKACADFPSVSYVLAFDDVAVARALGERYAGGDEKDGRAFLEKIIQVPLKLPVAAREDLRSMCFERVETALTAVGIELSQKQVGEFISGFDRGVSVRLDTPRAAKRFGNALLFSLPMLKDEVHLVDLLLLEALRAFYPAIYDCIRNAHEHFSGVGDERGGRKDDEPPSVRLLEPLLGTMTTEEQEAVKQLLVDLFPRLSAVYGLGSYGSEHLERWTREKRVCSPDYCPRFFTYTVSDSDIRDSEIADLLKAASNAETTAVEMLLNEYLTGKRARRLIEKLRAVEGTVDPKAGVVLSEALAPLGGLIPNPVTLYDFTAPPAQAGILISHLIKRSEAAERIEIAKRVIATAEPLWFGAECMRWLRGSDDPSKAEHDTLTKEQEEEVRRVLVERLKERAADGRPLFDPEVGQELSLLYDWWRAEGREPVQSHLLSVFDRDPNQIGRFLEAMAPRSWSQGDVVPRVGDIDGNQIKNISCIIDLDALAHLIRKHLPGDFENPQWLRDDDKPVEERLAEQFMFVYKKRTAEGGPADDKPNG